VPKTTKSGKMPIFNAYFVMFKVLRQRDPGIS